MFNISKYKCNIYFFVIAITVLLACTVVHEGGHYYTAKFVGVENPTLGFQYGIPQHVNVSVEANSIEEVNYKISIISIAGIITGLIPCIIFYLIRPYIFSEILFNKTDAKMIFVAYLAGCIEDIILILKALTNNLI